jgi:predicted phage terminase large subunit-like protein
MTKTEFNAAIESYRTKSKYIRELTYNSIVQETAEQQEERIRFLLRPENYTKFFDYYFGVGVSEELADAPCADFHQSSYEKVFADPFIVQMRKWYRGSAKSIHTNVGNVCHLKENNDLYFGVLIGKNGDLAKILLSDLQLQLESNERYIKDFGSQVSYGDWADGQFETLDGRMFKALGINQPFRGLRRGANRVDFASVDDCEDRKQAKNRELVQDYSDKITGDLGKAFHLRRGRLIVPNNYIVKGGILDGIKEGFKHSKHFDESVINLSDKNGNPTWHQRLSRNDVKLIDAKTDYYTSQREDYNNPIEKGKLFKAEWLKYEKIPEDMIWDGAIAHWDLSYTRNGDFKACAILGFKNGKIYLLDAFCRQCDLPEAMEWHFSKLREYAKKGISILSYYDASVAQAAIFLPAWLAAAEREKYASVPLPNHTSTDKHLRIEATLTDVFFNKLIVINKDVKDTHDWEKAVEQILSFEKGTKAHDDFPDTLENAVRLGRTYFGYSENQYSGNKPYIGKKKKRRV